MSQAQNYSYDDAPAQRVITDVRAKLSSLQDNNNNPSFNTVIPLTQISFAEILESATPGAFVYFGEQADGMDTANQFDEIYFMPELEILFTDYIPNNNDGTYPDVQRFMLQKHWKVIQNLRVPTDDVSTGIPYQKNSDGELIWEFRAKDGSGAWVKHNFDVNKKWISMGRKIQPQFFLHSIRIPVIVSNYVPQT